MPRASSSVPPPVPSSPQGVGSIPPGGGLNTHRTLVPGSTVLQRYVIQKVIGRGGMATVYLAVNQETERLVALKILDPEISNDPSYVERFRREARAAGRIRSDHVVAIYDLGTDVSGTLVLVMEYLDGQTVQQALRGGPLAIPRVIALGRHLCEGLAAAHENGVIHRDLKPANLFIERLPAGAEKLKVLDFGISKLAEASSQELTRAGQTLGTLAYMAPEQIRGTVKGQDPRLDLYAAGVSIFMMLTAKRPIDAEDTVQLLQAVLERDALTLEAASGTKFSKALEAFVAKALQKDPLKRFQSAVEMRDALIAAGSATDDAPEDEFEFDGVSATIMTEAPVFPMHGTTPASGVIAHGSGMSLPVFDDDSEEGKTVVRSPGSNPKSGENPVATVLPAAGQRVSAMRAPTMNPVGAPRSTVIGVPGPPPSVPGLPPSAMQPPQGAMGQGPVERTMIADSPLSHNPPPPRTTQAMEGFAPPPGMSFPNGAQGAPTMPPMHGQNMSMQGIPGMPMGAVPPLSAFGPPPPPPVQAAKKRSPLAIALAGATVLAVVLAGAAGYVATHQPTNATTPDVVGARVLAAPSNAVVPAPSEAPVAQPLQPTPAVQAAPSEAPVAQPLAPAPSVEAPVAQPLAPAPSLAAPEVPPLAPVAPAPSVAAQANDDHHARPRGHPHGAQHPAAPAVTHPAATHPAAPAAPTRVVPTRAPTPVAAPPAPSHPARPTRRQRGIVVDMPF